MTLEKGGEMRVWLITLQCCCTEVWGGEGARRKQFGEWARVPLDSFATLKSGVERKNIQVALLTSFGHVRRSQIGTKFPGAFQTT